MLAKQPQNDRQVRSGSDPGLSGSCDTSVDPSYSDKDSAKVYKTPETGCHLPAIGRWPEVQDVHLSCTDLSRGASDLHGDVSPCTGHSDMGGQGDIEESLRAHIHTKVQCLECRREHMVGSSCTPSMKDSNQNENKKSKKNKNDKNSEGGVSVSVKCTSRSMIECSHVRCVLVTLCNYAREAQSLVNYSESELVRKKKFAEECLSFLEKVPQSFYSYPGVDKLWVKVARRYIAATCAAIGLARHDNRRFTLQVAFDNATTGVYSQTQLILGSTAISPNETWVAQAGAPILGASHVRGGSCWEPLGCYVEDDLECSVAYDKAVSAMYDIAMLSIPLSLHCSQVIEDGERCKLREHMLTIYNRVVDQLNGPTGESEEWVAQSSIESMIRKLKIDERIANATTHTGLGKGRKIHGVPKSKRLHRLGTPPSSQPQSSNRRELKGRIASEREFKRRHGEFPLEAQMNSFIPSIPVTISSPPEVHQILEKLTAVVDDGITLKVDLFSSFFSSIGGHISSAGDHIKHFAIGVTVAYCSYRAMYTQGGTWKALAALSMAVATYLIVDMELLKRLSSIVESAGTSVLNAVRGTNDNFEAQSSKDNIITATLMYVYASTCRGLKGDSLVTEYIKKCSDVPKWTNGLSFQLDFFMATIQKFLNWMHVRFDTPEFIIQQQPYPEAHQVMLEVDKTLMAFNNGADLNYDNGMAFYTLQRKVQNIQARVPSNMPEGREARRALEATLASMRPILARLARSNIVDNGPRVAPLGVIIAGPSGLGKTDMMTYLINQVTASILPESKLESFRRNHNDVTYTRHAEVEFWDGYHGQFNVYIDDIGQTRDVAGNTNNEYMEVIRMIGPGCYGLNMAHLEDKGNTHFRSKMVYATTNQHKFHLQSLHFDEPFCRRWTVSYLMSIKKEFAMQPAPADPRDRRVHHFPVHRADKSHLEFYPLNVETGELTMAPISYDQLVSIIVAEYGSRNANGESMMSTHQADKERHIDARLASEKIVPQMSDCVRSAPSIYQEASSSFVLNLPSGLRESIPDDVPKGSDSDILKTIAAEASVSPEFVIENASKVDASEGWYIFLASIKSLAEELQESSGHTNLSTGANSYILRCTKYLDKAKEIVAANKLCIAAVLTTLSTLKVAYSYFNSPSDEIDPQSVGGMRHSSYRQYQKPDSFVKGGEKFKTFSLKPRTPGGGHRQLRGHRDYETQAGSDPNAADVLVKVVRENQYVFRLPGNVAPAGKITFVVPWIAIAPLHFGERLQYGIETGEYGCDTSVEIWSVVTPSKTVTIPVSQLEIVASEIGANNDWCLIKIPRVIERSKNILRRWAKETSFIDQGQFRCVIGLHDGEHPHLYEAKASPRKGIKYEQYDVTHGYEYDVPTKSGDCGSLIVQCNRSANTGKLIGIHTAGQGTKGFGPRILRGDLEHALSGFDGTSPDIEDTDIDDQPPCVDDPPGFRAQCRGRYVHTPSNTNIRRTPLHSTYVESVMAPAALKPKLVDGVVVDPMSIARAKYSKPVRAMNHILLDVARDYVMSVMINQSVNDAPWSAPKVFTFEEAVGGIPGVDFMEGIPRNTSAGYPYRLDVPPGHKGKTHFFGDGDAYEFISPECCKLRDRVQEVIAMAAHGKRRLHVYTDFLKDERRPVDKVARCKTRMVSASPLDLLVAHRMYFMDFVRWYMSNRISNGSAVGINCYSSEWSLLVKHLLSVSDGDSHCLIAGDYSGFDGSITAQIQYVVLRMINEWYGDEHSLTREVLWEDICASRHISGDVIYQWSGANPSGCFMTTVLNTMVNSLLIAYVYADNYVLHNGISISDLVPVDVIRHMGANLRFMCFGDDNLICVSKEASRFVDQGSVTTSLGDVGYVYTSEDKLESNAHVLRSLDDVSFLKRGFLHSPRTGLFVAPLELSVVLEMPMWTTKRDVDFVDAKVNVDNALRELSLHPKCTFTKWAPRIISDSIRYLNYSPRSTSYDALQAECLAQTNLL